MRYKWAKHNLLQKRKSVTSRYHGSKIIGSSSNDDGDCNLNSQKAIQQLCPFVTLTLYSSLATVVAWPTLAHRPLEWPKKKHFYRVTLLVSFLGQNAELLDPPIRRKIKAPLGLYSVTSAHAVELFWIF